MTEGIIIALITGILAFLGNAILAHQGRVKDTAERARLDERTDQRLLAIEHELTELKAQVREHNGLKQDIAALRADVRNLEKSKV
jgi:hypothetical protein